MRSLLASLLILAAPASAWEYAEGEPVVMPSPVTGVRAAPMGEREVILAMGADETWIVDPVHGEIVRTLDRGAHSLAVADVDGDGRDELVGCGESGLWTVPWTGRYGGEAVDHDLRACSAVVVVDRGLLSGVVAAGDGWLSHYDATETGLRPSGTPPFDPLQGAPLLATDGDRVAYAVVGGESVFERSAQGVSSYATGGALGDLAWARGSWTWTLPDKYAVADDANREVPLPDARHLLPAGEQLLVVGDGVSTWLAGGEVLAIATPVGVVHAATAAFEDDGCVDVIVSDGKSVTALAGVCEPAVSETAPPEPTADPDEEGPRLRPARVRRRRMVLGVEVPSFLGNRQVTPSERSKAQRYVVVGSGWAMGATLGPTEVQIPFFPALALGYEIGGPHTRVYMGVDSAALFFWLRSDNRGGGIHLANATLGMTFGSPALRAGPFITGGLLNYGAGVRAALTPWTAGGSSKGIEARLTWFGPSTGEVMILYVWSQPLRRARDRWDDTDKEPVRSSDEYPELSRITVKADPDDTGKPFKTRSRAPLCGEFSVGAGAAISASSTVYSWTHVGAGNSVAFGGSPAVALACGSGFEGKRALALHLGMETAPFLRYLLFNGANSGNDHLSHFGTLSLGLSLGNERFHAGPLGVAGIWALGGGARAVIGLHTDRQGLQHRLEVRGVALYKGAPAAEAFLLYGFSWDPWKDPTFRDERKGR